MPPYTDIEDDSVGGNLTIGTFLITSGGAIPAISGEATNGALAALAGRGTFSSAGQPAGTWKLVEHLRIT